MVGTDQFRQSPELVTISFLLPELFASKPNYEIGSAVKLSFGKSAQKQAETAKVWKLDADDDEEEINEDDLLDEEDKKKPDEASLRVCGTTGKRKACKDCSCGLAEELVAEKTGSANGVDTANAKSSCGSVSIWGFPLNFHQLLTTTPPSFSAT